MAILSNCFINSMLSPIEIPTGCCGTGQVDSKIYMVTQKSKIARILLKKPQDGTPYSMR